MRNNKKEVVPYPLLLSTLLIVVTPLCVHVLFTVEGNHATLKRASSNGGAEISAVMSAENTANATLQVRYRTASFYGQQRLRNHISVPPPRGEEWMKGQKYEQLLCCSQLQLMACRESTKEQQLNIAQRNRTRQVAIVHGMNLLLSLHAAVVASHFPPLCHPFPFAG